MEEKQIDNSNPSKTSKGFKINKTMLLVAGLVILTGILLAISLSTKNSSPVPTLNKTEEKDMAQTSLSISEEPRIGTASGTYEVDVNIDSKDNKITGTQLELSYDPKALTKVDIKSGDFLFDPVVILKKIDTKNGKITYVIGSQLGEAGIQGKGTVAVISFSKANEEETTIDFLPQTLVTAEGSDQSVLSETISGIIGKIETTNSNQTP